VFERASGFKQKSFELGSVNFANAKIVNCDCYSFSLRKFTILLLFSINHVVAILVQIPDKARFFFRWNLSFPVKEELLAV
jgi:hypothetical protein